MEIVKRALKSPCATIARNAGVNGEQVVEKILKAEKPTEGYDALNNKFVDMIEAGMYTRNIHVCMYVCMYVWEKLSRQERV